MALPVNAYVAGYAAQMHTPRQINGLSSADQHLLRIAPAQRARSTERAMIDNCHRASCTAQVSSGNPGSRTGTDHHDVISVHEHAPCSASARESSRTPADRPHVDRDGTGVTVLRSLVRQMRDLCAPMSFSRGVHARFGRELPIYRRSIDDSASSGSRACCHAGSSPPLRCQA